MADILSYSTFREIENCGRIATLEQSDAVTAALQEWLTLTVQQSPEQQLK